MFEAEMRHRETPGVGTYSPSPLSANHRRHESAAFVSTTERLHPHKSHSPGPGSYAPTNGAAESGRRIRRSSSFGSTSSRFVSNRTLSPGPGAYESGARLATASPRSHLPASAGFASTSERTQLPTNKSAAIVPGPGAYGPPRNAAPRGIRRSASFASTSSRLRGPPKDAKATPPPGAYNPNRTFSATQRYSRTGIVRRAI